jgi:hypothetical protein
VVEKISTEIDHPNALYGSIVHTKSASEPLPFASGMGRREPDAVGRISAETDRWTAPEL